MTSKPFRLAALMLCSLALFACSTPNNTPKATSSDVMPLPQKNTGPITIKGNCQQREQDGYADRITVEVDKNNVKALDWTAQPRGRSCRFELKNFTQVSNQPIADLQSKKDKKCHVYMWQDDDHITVAVYACKKQCRSNDKILPVLLDPKTGNCQPKKG